MRRAPVLVLLLLTACASSSGVDGTSPPSTTTTTTTVPVGTTAAATTSTTEPRTRVCDGIGEDPLVLGTIDDPALSEISGIARSVAGPGSWWAHNDSGAPPRLWAIGPDGAVLGYVEVRARNVDWEDVSLGPGPDGTTWVYLADIGDNLQRRDLVWIHRFAEPTAVGGVADDVQSLSITYPIDPVDAEALLVDPITGDSFIITKSVSGRSAVLRVPAGAWSQQAAEAELVATVDLGSLAFVTGADISADGSVVAVRTYGDVWLWERESGETVTDALKGRPCRAPAAGEPQGEAVALDDSGYTTISEGTDATVYRFDGLGG